MIVTLTLAIILSGLMPRFSTFWVHTSVPPWKPALTGLNSLLMHSSASLAVSRPSPTCLKHEIVSDCQCCF